MMNIDVSDPSRVVLFSHIDLDGFGCRVLLQKCYPNLVVRHVDYGFESNMENLLEMKSASHLFITDISIIPEIAEALNHAVEWAGKFVVLLDHHETAMKKLTDLRYEWIHFSPDKSGTLMTWEFLMKQFPEQMTPYGEFAKLVSGYDLWDHSDGRSISLQFLWSHDNEAFVDRFLRNPEVEFFGPEMTDIIGPAWEVLLQSVMDSEKSLKYYVDLEGNKFATMMPEGRYASLVSDRILRAHSEIEYLVMFNKYKPSLSFRSLHYPVNLIAESLGGGGHKLAAGAGIPQDGMYDATESIKSRTWIKFDPLIKLSERAK